MGSKRLCRHVLVLSLLILLPPLPARASTGPAHLVKDIDTGMYGSGPLGLIALGRSVLFVVSDRGFHPGTLWKSDGTAEGTVVVKNVTAQFHNWETRVADTVFFPGKDVTHGIELWKTDGTEDGTALVKDIFPGPGNISAPVSGVALAGRLFFVPLDPDYGREPWISDGTDEGTHLLKDIGPGPDASTPYPVASDGTIAYFGASPNYGPPLFSRPLWKSDGTEDGTMIVNDVKVASSGDTFRFAGRTLFFLGDDGIHGAELWKSDGTEAGTVLVRDLTPGADPTYAERFTDVEGTLFFFRYSPGGNAELWKSDGSENGTVLVKDLAGGTATEAIAAGRALFFVSVGGVGQIGLWRSDGTEAGTRIVRANDVDEGDQLRRGRLGAVGGVVLFSASAGVSGYELWRSDGTESGTFPVQEIAPGPDSSHPHGFVVAGSRLFFAADDIIHGDELWSGRASILTGQPRLALQDLRADVEALGLPQGIATSLLAKLAAAEKSLDARSLDAFLHEIRALRGKKISAEAADDLGEFAAQIIDLITGE